MLLSTDNKQLIYITNERLFDQEWPILGKTAEGHGDNLLGLVYEKIRREERHRQAAKKDIDTAKEQDEKIIQIILLTKILQSEMLTKYDDLQSLQTMTFDNLYDKYKFDIDNIMHLDKILLEQYKRGNMANRSLIDQIVSDIDHIIYYIQNYYRESFNIKVRLSKRMELVRHFLKEKLKANNLEEFQDNEIALEHELEGQFNKIAARGAEYTKQLFDRINNLYDSGKEKIPDEINEKYKTADEPFTKKHKYSVDDEHATSAPDSQQSDDDDDILAMGEPHIEDPDAAAAGVSQQSSSQSSASAGAVGGVGVGVPLSTASSEIEALHRISGSEDIFGSEIPIQSAELVDIENQETLNYILFTDKPGSYQKLSPTYTGTFSDASLFYPNLLGYYYVKLVYSFGNIVHTKQADKLLAVPGNNPPPRHMLSLQKAHKFIMIPECQKN